MSVSNSHEMYLKNVHTEFQENERHHLKVTIDTPNLHFRSVEMTDLDNYAALFADQEVMDKFAAGKTKTRDEVAKRISMWVQRWKSKDPYSGFAIFKKEGDGKTFVGHAIVGHGNQPGEAVPAIVIKKEFWKQGYATEAMTAALYHYVPKLLKKGYLVDGKALEVIRATARPDNEASWKVLERAGMTHEKDAEEFGAMRKHYALFIVEKSKKTATVKKVQTVKKSKEVTKTPKQNDGIKLRSGTICRYRADLHNVRYRSRARL